MTGTLVGPHTNTWAHEKSRKVTSELESENTAAAPNISLLGLCFMRRAHLQIKLVLIALMAISLIQSLLESYDPG